MANLIVDDLIVEYMMYKVEKGYEPKFLTSEFINFLHFFESKMKVNDLLYDESEKLFQRFFERKLEKTWSVVQPSMEMEYSEKDDDYIIKANYKLSDYDKSTINTYFMDNGRSKFTDFKGTAAKIRDIIGEYLSDQPKRIIDETTEISEKDLVIGKYVSAEIVTQIWLSYIDEQIENQKWPRQCKDINKYLFEIDLSEIIGIPSIKDELIELYNVISKRIAILYLQDRNLNVTSYQGSYLARANYDLLIQGYEKIIGIAFGPYKKSMNFDLSSLKFKESHEIAGVYFEDDDPDVKTTVTDIENDKVKTLVRNIEKIKYN